VKAYHPALISLNHEAYSHRTPAAGRGLAGL